MFSLFKWIKHCFSNILFGQVKTELISKINAAADIQQTVKEDLISSVLQDNPEKLVAQINDKNNKIPEIIKSELMNSIMKTETEQVEHPEIVYNDDESDEEVKPVRKEKKKRIAINKPTKNVIIQKPPLKPYKFMKNKNLKMDCKWNQHY